MSEIDFDQGWSVDNSFTSSVTLKDGTVVESNQPFFSGKSSCEFVTKYDHYLTVVPDIFKSLHQAALSKAIEQAIRDCNATKKLVNVPHDNTPVPPDQTTKDGEINTVETPSDLQDSDSITENKDAAIISAVRKIEPEENNSLPPQSPPAGEAEKRSNDKTTDSTTGGDPVDLFTGEFYLEKIDFELPSVGFPFVLIRTYRSGTPYFGPWGYNWDHNYNIYIRELNNGSIAMNTGKLQEDIYTDSGDGTVYNSPRGRFSLMEKQSAFSSYDYIIVFKDGTKWFFKRPVGWSHAEKIPLERIEDSNGNFQELIYNNQNQLASVIDTVGRKINFMYGHCDLLEAIQPEFLQISGEPAIEIKYLHANDIEHLSAVITLPTPDFPEGLITCYEYDVVQPLAVQRNNITRIIDAKDQVIVENFYGTDTTEDNFNRVIKQYFMGGEYLFKYSSIRYIPPFEEYINDACLQTEFYEPERPLKVFTFNFRGNLLDERYRLCADGSYRVWAQSYRYNKYGQLTEFYYANGMAEIYTYDENNQDPLAQGNLLRIDQLSQPSRTTNRMLQRFTYEPVFQKIKTVTDESGATTTFVYDHENDPLIVKGNLEEVHYPDCTLPDGSIQNNCISIFKYDQHGQLISETSPEGRKTTMEYYLAGPGAGLIKKLSKHDGNNTINQLFEYDGLGNVSKKVDEKGNDTLFSYNLLGQLVKIELPAINGNRAVFKYEYNEDRKIAKEYTPRGSYNDSVIQGSWIIHEYRYDVASWLVQEIKNANTAFPQIIKYTRDFHGNIIKVVNPLGQESKYQYDERNLLLKEIAFSNTSYPLTTRYQYDRIGNLVKTILPDGNQMVMDFSDIYSRLKSKTNHLGVSVNYEYGARDLVKKMVTKDLNGQILHTYLNNYDEKGRLITTDFNGLISQTYYDKDGLTTKTIYHNGNEIKMVYDGLGRLVQRIDPIGNVLNQKYDANGNIDSTTTEVTSAQTGSILNIKNITTYDTRNRIVSVSDDFGNISQYAYDDRDLITKVTDSLGNEARIYYDLNGQILKNSIVVGGNEIPTNRCHRDIVGRLLKYEDADGNMTVYEYDDRNNLIKIIYPDESEITKRYNSFNYLERETDANGTVTDFEYTPQKQLARLSFQTAIGVQSTVPISYGYDSFGRNNLLVKGTHQIERKFDFLNRITEEKQNGKTISKIYNDVTNQMKLLFTDSREDVYQFDKIGRLSQLIFSKKGTNNLLINDFSEGTKLVEYMYDGLFLEAKKLANGTITNYFYDKEAKLTGFEVKNTSGNLIDKELYFYDGEKRKQLTLREPLRSMNKILKYDELSRLTETKTIVDNVQPPNGLNDQAAIDNFINGINTSNVIEKENYTLSYSDKRTSWEENSLVCAPTYNSLLQLDAVNISNGNSIQYKYDKNGNRIEDNEFFYQYDVFDKLTRVTKKSNGQLVLENIYDAEGRIIEKVENGISSKYMLDGLRNIEENINNQLKQNTFGIGLDELLISSKPNTNLFFHYNDLNSLQTLTDKSGSSVQRFAYSSFGKPTVYDNANNVVGINAILAAPVFGGRSFNKDINLYEFRQRFYDPQIGSFLQRDIYDYADSSNAYLFCKHNPINVTDPKGNLAPIVIGLIAAAAGGGGLGAAFGSIRQVLQIQSGYTDEYGNVKEEFDLNELGMNIGIGGLMGMGMVAAPMIVGGIGISLGVLSGISEVSNGNRVVGVFDLATSVLGARGLKNFNGGSVRSRFENLGTRTLGLKKHLSDWWNYGRDADAEMKPVISSNGELESFGPYTGKWAFLNKFGLSQGYKSTIAYDRPPQSMNWFEKMDSTVHETIHALVMRYLPSWVDLANHLRFGEYVGPFMNHFEETVAYAGGRAASLRAHAIPLAPFHALRSLRSSQRATVYAGALIGGGLYAGYKLFNWNEDQYADDRKVSKPKDKSPSKKN
jgi:RHS repeat-associated protein